MAKGKKTKKTTHRRRVSGAGNSDALMMGAGAAIGGAGGWYVYTTQKTIQDSLMGALQLAVGGGLLYFIKNPIAKGVGAGLLASGGIILGESFGVLSGVTNLPSNSSKLKIAGYEAVRQLGAVPGATFPSPAGIGRFSPKKFAGGAMK